MVPYFSAETTSTLLALRKQRLNLAFDLEEESNCLSLDCLFEQEKPAKETSRLPSRSHSPLPCKDDVLSETELIARAGKLESFTTKLSKININITLFSMTVLIKMSI